MKARGRRHVPVCFLLSLIVFVLQSCSCCFGLRKQPLLSDVRERTGLAIHKSARDMGGPPMSRSEKELVRLIGAAGRERDWQSAKSLFGSYSGSAPQVYSAVMHAAFKSKQYKEGAKIYEKCQANCEVINEPVFTAALRIFAKLGDNARVQQIWNEALRRLERWDSILGSARIVAAAEAGDVEAAAETLDTMNASNISVCVYHINSAMRACWGWGDRQHKAAKYFFDLLPQFNQTPTIVSFTNLIGAYKTASLREMLSAYDEMKKLEIEPDPVFADTYLFSLVQRETTQNKIVSAKATLRGWPSERLQAARDALNDFKHAGFRMQKFCRDVDKELTAMGF